jgi:Uncharacterized protein conserved in bacteria
MGKKRKISIELLRIIMMLQVIFLHVSYYGGYASAAQSKGGISALLYWILWLNSRCPVYMFIIIMGYFLCESGTTLKIDRFLKTYITMMFYSVGIVLVVGIINPNYVNINWFIRSVLPVMSKTWYFMSLYFLMLVISPYINKLISQLDKKEHLILLGICFAIFCVWQQMTILKPFDNVLSVKNVISTDGGKSLYDFIFMYLIGAFLRKYKLFELRRGIYLLGFILAGAINILLVYIYPDPAIRTLVTNNDNFFVVIQCICLFRFFETMDSKKFKKSGKLINYISAGNLGVYMIHEHPIIRKLIWEKIFRTNNNEAFYNSPFVILKIIGIIVIIYISCWMVDFIRRFFIRKIVSK